MPRMKRLRGQLKYPAVVDGRNLYDPDVMSAQGFTHYSVGRIMAAPEAAAGRPLKKL